MPKPSDTLQSACKWCYLVISPHMLLSHVNSFHREGDPDKLECGDCHKSWYKSQSKNRHEVVCPKGNQEGRALADTRVWNDETKELSLPEGASGWTEKKGYIWTNPVLDRRRRRSSVSQSKSAKRLVTPKKKSLQQPLPPFNPSSSSAPAAETDSTNIGQMGIAEDWNVPSGSSNPKMDTALPSNEPQSACRWGYIVIQPYHLHVHIKSFHTIGDPGKGECGICHKSWFKAQVRNAHSRVCPKGEQQGRAFDDERVWIEDTKELSLPEGASGWTEKKGYLYAWEDFIDYSPSASPGPATASRERTPTAQTSPRPSSPSRHSHVDQSLSKPRIFSYRQLKIYRMNL